MKISNKLTFQFIGIVSVILAIVLFIIYSLSAIHTRDQFYDRLEERAFSAANIFLEQDEVTKERYEEFQKKYLQALSDEIIQVFDSIGSNVFITRNERVSFSQSTLERIRRERAVRYVEGDRQFVGIYYEDNQGNFVIISSAADLAGFERLANLRLILLLSFFGSLAVVYVAGRFFSHRALSPMRDIVRQVRTITASNLHRRVSEGNGKDEIAELAKTFNETLGRLRQSFEMQKTFVNNASHELRTPLTAMIGEIEVLLTKDREKNDYAATLANVLQEAEELKELTNMLLSLAQTDIGESANPLEEIRIDELMWDVKQRIFEKNAGADIVISMENLPSDPEGLSVLGNRHLLSAAFSNVLENAVKFSDNKRVACHLEWRPRDVAIIVKDTGVGMTEGDLRNIFQPFFRGENARRFHGHGIGLVLAQKIIRLHGGSISVDSVVDVGTNVTMVLPHNHF